MAFGTNRTLKPYHRPLLAGLSYQNNTSTYVFRNSFGCFKNQQAILSHASYVFPTSPGVPTVDPGLSAASFLSKVWYDQTGNAVGNKTRPIMHFGCDSQWIFKSANEVPIEINIYHVIARRDSRTEPIQAWLIGLNDTYKAYTDTYANATPSVYSLGMTPYMSTPFCQNFKILGNKRVTLGPGEVHRAYVKQKCMKLFDGQSYNSTEPFRKGWTYHVIVVARATVANDVDGDVGVPGIKVNYEVKQKYKWKLLNELNRDQIYYADNSILQSSIGAFRDINEETGQLDTVLDQA